MIQDISSPFKVFFGTSYLSITPGNSLESVDLKLKGVQETISMDEFRTVAREIVISLEHNKGTSVEVAGADAEAVLNALKDAHDAFIVAAGGLVTNPAGEVLMIFRRGFWDLPKGKLEPNEAPAEGAVREVMEETGLAKVKLGEFLLSTYHSYQLMGQRVLKESQWFRMYADGEQLTPQAEEDITEAIWCPVAKLPELAGKAHENIKRVLNTL